MVKKVPKIRIRQKDKDLISKLNKSLYAKERRLNIEFGKSMNFERKFIDEFKTRGEFNEYVEQAKHHTNRNQHRYVKNKKGFVTTRKSYRKAKRQDERYQRRQRKELKKIREQPMTSGGKPTKWTVGDFDTDTTMGRPNLDYLKMPKFNFDNIENMREWEMKQRTLDQRGDDEYIQRKKNQLHENYKKAIRQVFGHGEDKIDKNDIGWSLYDRIDKMETEEFNYYFMTEFDVSIGFIYNSIQKILKLNRLHNIFGVEELDPDEWGYIEQDDFEEGDNPTDYWL